MKRTADRRRNRYIESEKGQTRMYRAREVYDWALPDCSCEADESIRSRLDTEEGKRVEGASCWEWVLVVGMRQQDARELEGLGVHC